MLQTSISYFPIAFYESLHFLTSLPVLSMLNLFVCSTRIKLGSPTYQASALPLSYTMSPRQHFQFSVFWSFSVARHVVLIWSTLLILHAYFLITLSLKSYSNIFLHILFDCLLIGLLDNVFHINLLPDTYFTNVHDFL